MKDKLKRKKHILKPLKNFTGTSIYIGIFIMGLSFCFPIGMLLVGSISDKGELLARLSPMIKDSGSYVSWKWIPDYPTLQNYLEIFIYSPAFLKLFWNSMKMVGIILLGQMFVAIPCSWSLAVYKFKGKNILFTLYVVLMLMPFQVTMLSRYLVLNNLGLMNTEWSVILPGIFSTFPIFIIYRAFCTVPQELLEAARIDGAKEWLIFVKIGLPLGQGGIFSAIILCFLEYWNLVEEPLAYLKDKSLWPLSLYLPEISLSRVGYAFATSFVTLLTSLFIFSIFRESLEKGIVAGALKE